MLLVQTICRNLEAAAKNVLGVSYTVVLRGDSTLRGHFPEVNIKIRTCLIFFSSFSFSMVIIILLSRKLMQLSQY